MSNVTPISPEPTAEPESNIPAGFDLAAELRRYESRKASLLRQVAEAVDVKKAAQKTITACRAELRTVERMISASKPRVRKAAAK